MTLWERIEALVEEFQRDADRAAERRAHTTAVDMRVAANRLRAALAADRMSGEQARNLLSRESGARWVDLGAREHFIRACEATWMSGSGGPDERWGQVQTAGRALGLIA